MVKLLHWFSCWSEYSSSEVPFTLSCSPFFSRFTIIGRPVYYRFSFLLNFKNVNRHWVSTDSFLFSSISSSTFTSGILISTCSEKRSVLIQPMVKLSPKMEKWRTMEPTYDWLPKWFSNKLLHVISLFKDNLSFPYFLFNLYNFLLQLLRKVFATTFVVRNSES